MRRLFSSTSVTALAATALAAVTLAAGQTAPAAATAAHSSCSTGQVAFTRFAFPASPHSPSTFPGANDFAAFSAVNHGVWAGIEFNANTRYVYAITQRSGHRPRVLDKFHYGPYITFNTATSIHMIGVDPAGAAVASVQPTQKKVTTAYRSRLGLWWGSGGRRHVLSHAKSWLSFEPVAISRSGRVVGWAATGSASIPRYHLISWDRVGHHYRTLAHLGYQQPVIAMDADGDIAYTTPNGAPAVRTAGGKTIAARVPSGAITSMGAGAHTIYAATSTGVYGWDLSRTGGSTLGRTFSSAAGGRATVDAVGSRGDMVMNSPGSATLRTASGRHVGLPSMGVYSAQNTTAISSHGWIAFTSARDRRIHFMHCG